MIPQITAGWRYSSSISNLFLIQFGACGVGAWISSRNPRRSLVLGYGLATAGLCGLGLGWWAAPIAVGVVGFGLGLSIPATNVLVARQNPERRGAALTYVNLLWGLGAIGCQLLFAGLAYAGDTRVAGGAPWVLALCAAAAWLAVARTTTPERSMEAESGVAPVTEPFALLTLQLFAYSGTECTIGGWIVKYYADVDATPGRAFIVNAFFWTGLLVGRVIAPSILARMREPTLHVIALAIAAGGAMDLLVARSFSAFDVGAFVVGLGLAPIFPLLASAVVGKTEGAPRRVSGIIFSLGGLGAGVVPRIAGQLAEHTSLRQAFLVPVIGVVAMGLLLWRYRALSEGMPTPLVPHLDESPRIS